MNVKKCDKCGVYGTPDSASRIPQNWIRFALQSPHPNYRVVNFDLCPKCKNIFNKALGEKVGKPNEERDLLAALEHFVIEIMEGGH